MVKGFYNTHKPFLNMDRFLHYACVSTIAFYSISRFAPNLLALFLKWWHNYAFPYSHLLISLLYIACCSQPNFLVCFRWIHYQYQTCWNWDSTGTSAWHPRLLQGGGKPSLQWQATPPSCPLLSDHARRIHHICAVVWSTCTWLSIHCTHQKRYIRFLAWNMYILSYNLLLGRWLLEY